MSHISRTTLKNWVFLLVLIFAFLMHVIGIGTLLSFKFLQSKGFIIATIIVIVVIGLMVTSHLLVHRTPRSKDKKTKSHGGAD